MKFSRRVSGYLMSVVMALIIVQSTVCAAPITGKLAKNSVVVPKEYQTVIDKVNAEMGSEARVATPEELAALGFAAEPMTNKSLITFEKELRADIIADRKATAEAEAQIERRKGDKILESGSGKSMTFIGSEPDGIIGSIISGKDNMIMAASTLKKASKIIAGGKIWLEAYVGTNSSGGKIFTELKSTYSTWVVGNSTPIFVSTTYSYSRLDLGRTYALSHKGYTMTTDRVIVSTNASRYVEFYASSM